jgi:hypothetical protein
MKKKNKMTIMRRRRKKKTFLDSYDRKRTAVQTKEPTSRPKNY